nr:hypothetical protein [Tanacetum cinerariifolium]
MEMRVQNGDGVTRFCAYSNLLLLVRLIKSVLGKFFMNEEVNMVVDVHDLLDLLKSFEIGRKKEIQSLLKNGPISNFAHHNSLQSLLRGRFLWNKRFVQDKKSTSVAAS